MARILQKGAGLTDLTKGTARQPPGFQLSRRSVSQRPRLPQ
ncbi:hypothetical protein Z945_933 [Sulfitobacter noctilucae]|nr:hypothetical protein Z945_933 [Sulfitobacter noctilucae]